MRIFLDNCEIVGIVPHAFKDNMGEMVSYNEVYIHRFDDSRDPSVMKFNSKLERLNKGMLGTIELEIDETGQRKPRLIEFKPDLDIGNE